MIIVVCESVPTSVSGKATGPSRRPASRTTVARYSRLTWWTMPVPGGTTRRSRKAVCAQRRSCVALAVPLVLALDVEGEGAGVAEPVDLHGVVDDEVGRHQRVDARRVAAKVGHRVAHRGQVDDGGHAGEVLEDDAGGHERQLDVGRAELPGRQPASVSTSLGPDDPATGVAERVLEQDLDRHRDPAGVQAERPERAQPVEVGSSGTEAGPGTERVVDGQRGIPRWVARIECMEAYPER